MMRAAALADGSVWARVPLVVHPGFHKTGTTWLQNKVFAEGSGLPFHVLATPTETIGHLLLPSEHEFDPQIVRDAWESRLLEAEEKGAIAVITCERLADYPFQNPLSRSVIAQRLAAAFPAATVLWTIREQDSIILSMYGQTVRFGNSFTLEEFLYEPDRESGFRGILNYDYYEYDRVLDLYESLFDRVLMLPFEAIMADPQSMLDTLLSNFGKQSVPMTVSSEQQVNAALAPPARWTMRQINRFQTKELPGYRRSSVLKPNQIGAKIDQLTPDWIRRNGKLRDKALVREHVADRYREPNARLQEKLGIDLGALGYRLPG